MDKRYYCGLVGWLIAGFVGMALYGVCEVLYQDHQKIQQVWTALSQAQQQMQAQVKPPAPNGPTK